MHFQWFDREKNETSVDLIVINDAYFEKIEKCKDGRVYILRFTSSDKKLFFWMQDLRRRRTATRSSSRSSTRPSAPRSRRRAPGGRRPRLARGLPRRASTRS
ncbi:unnamed protein product [Prorocentrum cordatum]|uniref:Pru domain-containing protein n=1 Tax=Prorocentrum cordatum TaxID=2364126 RepID=A0ABN9Q8I3_9DINO|nr:unnamed protein product [Polarella glacialis]